MLESYKELAQEVIATAQKIGAELVTVSIGCTTSFQIEARNQQIDLLKEACSSGIHLTVCKNQRRSSITSNDLRMETLTPLISSTIKTLSYIGADKFYNLPDPSLQGRASADLKFFDTDFYQANTSEKIKNTLLQEKLTLDLDKRLHTEQAYYSDLISQAVYADSNGFIDGYEKSLFTRGMSAFVEDQSILGQNTARKQTDGWYSCARFYDKLEPLDSISHKTCERLIRKIGAVKPKSQEVPVVFSPEMARSFIGSVVSGMMGENIFRKQSFLLNRLETKIANENLQLRDDPLLAGKLGSRYFDSEGVKAQPLTLIENGIFQNYLLSTYSANKLNMKTNGCAGGSSNIVLEPGKYTEEELIASVKNGLYLTFMSGQGANITTGDYSRGAQGIWIRDGKLAEPVSEFTIASTFLDMLNNITMIACEVDERSSILCPAVKIQKMTVAGT
ncbi:MAG: TldD/PmbA family protein [SAR324 cluster bacterium]|nr:TldD/PmbA family protein [SAR324 cluster bacterium]